MPANEIENPVELFTEIDGSPLEAGYIYVGAENLDPESNPITVYWDRALTVVAAQPIRTINGYASNNGAAARFFVDADGYSITIRNKNGTLIDTDLSFRRAIPFSNVTGPSTILTQVDSVADLIAGSFSEDNILVNSYYGGWAASVNGPLGTHFRHKTGATNAAPTVGPPVAVSTIGHGAQAGYCWDASGAEWLLSQSESGVYEAAAFGVVSDNSGFAVPDGRDNAVELQDFFDFMRGRAAIFRLPPSIDQKIIYTSQPLDMTVDAASFDVYSPILDGNNNTITMRGSGYTGTTSVLTVGATSASVPGGQKIAIHNLEVHGPMLGDASFQPTVYTNTTAPAHTGAGIEIEKWINIELQNTVVQGCYFGFLNEEVWPVTEVNCRAEACYVGWFLKGDVTSRSSLRCRALGCRWALIAQPDATKQVYGQVFDGFHVENCLMGPVLDPVDGSGSGIHDIYFYNLYLEGIGYNDGTDKGDVFRVGKSADILDVTNAGSNRTRSIYQFVWEIGLESYPTNPSLGGIQAQFNGTTSSVKGVKVLRTRLGVEDIVNWTGVLAREWATGFVANFGDQVYTSLQGDFGFAFQAANATAIGPNIALSTVYGGVTVDKTANGVYTINFPTTNGSQFEVLPNHAVDRASFVTFDPVTGSTMEMRVYDTIGGTLAAAEPRIYVNFKQPS